MRSCPAPPAANDSKNYGPAEKPVGVNRHHLGAESIEVEGFVPKPRVWKMKTSMRARDRISEPKWFEVERLVSELRVRASDTGRIFRDFMSFVVTMSGALLHDSFSVPCSTPR
jgi:hypothetical protein